jgi:TonB family protein
MFDLKRLLLALFLVAAATQGAFPQSGGAQPAATPEVSAQSAKVAESNRLSVAVVKLHSQGKYDEALPLAEQALKLREDAFGREHPAVAQTLRNLGALYLAKGKAERGRQLYARAVSIYEKNPSAANNANLFKLLDALGLLERFAFNNYIASVERYERSLALKESSLGAEHEEVIKTLYDLAELYELLGRNDKALSMHRRALAIREKREATEPNELILALNRFACLSDRLHMKAETTEALRRVDEIVAREDARREREEAEQQASGANISVDDTVRGGVINGKAISKPQPVYPEAAKQQRISGTVTIYVMVDESGHVTEAYPCGHPILSEAALRAAYAARFSPTLLSGKPVKVRGLITYNFVLQ